MRERARARADPEADSTRESTSAFECPDQLSTHADELEDEEVEEVTNECRSVGLL